MLHLFSEPNKYRLSKPGLVLSVQFSCLFGFFLGRTKMKGDLNFDFFLFQTPCVVQRGDSSKQEVFVDK